jgi:protein-S-isoprenylcysteine O-methyltransferase Ste14
MLNVDPDSPQIRIPPPVGLVLCALAGIILHWIHPLPVLPPSWRVIVGAVFIGTGFGLIASSIQLFKKAGTAHLPWKSSTKLVSAGFYRQSRNPIYLGMVLISLGIAFEVNSLWGILTTIPLIVFLDRYPIRKEERYLEQKFGDEYRAYKKQVRRWI